MFYHRGSCHDVEALHYKIVALCALFCLSTFGPCTMTGTQNPLGHDEYGSYKNDLGSGSGSQDVLASGSRTSIPKLSLENVCKRSDLFCFPSTLSGFFSDFHSSEENISSISRVNDKPNRTLLLGSMEPTNGSFQLLSGSVVSCSLELKEDTHDTSYSQIDISDKNGAPSCRKSWKTREINQKDKFLSIKTSHADDFSSLNVEISHPVLDFGQKYLHFASLAFLNVENKHFESVLNIYKPYSTNAQFYPCNYSEIKLGPGENASICFVFLPKLLGLSSGHIILQTSSGGFLIWARGFAVEPPYVIQPSLGLNVISLFNPSDRPLHVKEVSARILFSSRNISYSTKAACSLVDHDGSSEISVNEWLDVKTGQVGQPVTAIRPHKTWTVDSNRSEPILELDFPYHSQEKVFGSFCFQLLSTSMDNSDTIVLEAEFDLKLKSPVLISLEVVTPCDANGTTGVSVLLENDGPDVLTVFKISVVGENTDFFQIKYVEGLILFAHTITQVAMVAYSPDHTNLNCKLLVQTNKSDGSELEISCSDIAGFCSQALNYENVERRSGNAHVQSPFRIKATEMTKADESILGNWRSQGTKTGMSVLDDNELIFPPVQLGTHQSKWIKVVNPSDQPIIMQLLLNSGEIINECRELDEISQPSSAYTLLFNSHTTPSRYGFSISGNASTEAYIHPKGKALLGPIIFHPSSRCTWRSSALVRNNLSGVEWLSLHGSGGSHSLLLLDGFGPLRIIQLNRGFDQPSMKVLFAKNTGDLVVKVNRISVSGTKCELDGFMVRNCKGFDLQPGESKKIIISYRTDYCAAIVRRELELGMPDGILAVPMEAIFPTSMLTICKRSLFWTRFKKFVIAVLISMACSCMFSFITKTSSGHEEHSSDVCSEPETVKVLTSSLPENAKPENLMVKTGKDKARRRKKKRSFGAGLMGQFEVSSSSHSSNSTPSSPLSPVLSLTPKRSPEIQVRSSSGMVFPARDKPSTLAKNVASHARAPGTGTKVVKPEEQNDKFKYNIWDDHLGLLPTIAKDSNFVSFFTVSPQELFGKSQPKTE